MARDDFTIKTKELVAQRVAYRCCFKGCGIATIGPKYGDALKTASIGVGCHIYAAAPNGPRYNPNMTADERKSPDNCIWMCQTHSRLIDTDEKAYPPTLLHQWKYDAEKAAAERLKEYQYSQTELSDKKTLEGIFETLIQEGQYDVLIMLIKQFKVSNSIDELLLRYEVIYNCYCNRNALFASIKSYLETVIDKKCDSIIKVLLSLNVKLGLQELISFCQDDELIKWAEAILKDTVQEVLFCPEEQIETAKQYEIKNKEIAANLLSYYIVEKQMLSLPKQADGKFFVLQEEDFVFKVRASAWRVFCKGFKGEDYIQDKRTSNDYIFLKNCISKILQLDKDLQMYIWITCLNYVMHDKNEFEQIYRLCPSYITTDIRCKRVYIAYCLLYNLENPNTLLNDNDVINDERALSFVLHSLSKDLRDQFLEEHKFLLSKSSVLLFLCTQNEAVSREEKYKTLIKYQNNYSSDFLWNCMVAYYADKGEGYKYLQWAKQHLCEMQYPTVELFIKVLKEYEEWEELKNLYSQIPDDNLRYMIVLAICASNTVENNFYCVELFKKLEENKFYRKYFYRNFAVLLSKTGDILQAKKYYEKEYDVEPDSNVLFELLQIKYECKDFKIDKYVEIASKENTEDLQYIVSAYYGQNNKFDLQKKYLIRSLLINPNKAEALHMLANVYLGHPDEDEYKFGKIYKLENNDKILNIALLNDSLIDKIPCQEIINCKVENDSDPKFISWKFSEINDEVNYNGTSYFVKEIMSFSENLFRESFTYFRKNGAITEIRGNSPQDAIKEIGKWLEKRKNGQQEIFNVFNASKGIFPVTLLAKQLGVDYYTTWGHIVGKNELKLNNYSKGTGVTYIMSNDAICTLCMLDAIKDIDVASIVFAKQSKNIISSMLSSKLNDLQDGSVGSLQIENGQIFRTEYDREYKKGASSFFGTLLEFVNGIKAIEAKPFISARQDVTDFFIKENLVSESYLLGLAQSNEQFVVVTDEPFVCIICELEKIPHISTIDLLFNQNLTHTAILNYLKRLGSFNFLNYFSPDIYKKIVDSVNGVDAEKRDKFLVELEEWLVPDKRSEEHSYRVFNVYKELVAEDAHSFYSYTLSSIGRFYFSELFPEKYQEIIDQFKNLRIEIVPPKNDTEE